MNQDAVEIQRSYYARTAAAYEALHVHENDEHYVALAWMLSCIDLLGCKSILDVGSGTGRAVTFVREQRPGVRIIGVEPSAELRAIGHRNGVPQEALVDGDAMKLDYEDGGFDLVCEFGVLHHVATPTTMVSQMLRVARKAIFISDDNHYAAGSNESRIAKRVFSAVGLWRAAYLLRTGGKGYRITAEDGVAYPYSVFDDLPTIRASCKRVHVLNTRGEGPNLRVGATHIALLGVKNGEA